ncbi:MAG: hypothetical protein R6U96_11605, partial [Promethearchaeia archaeon]
MKDKLFYLVVEINHSLIVTFNIDCQFCQNCDLIIIKRRELESYLCYTCEQQNLSELIGTEYSVIGLTDKEVWKKHLEKAGSFLSII